MTGSPCFSGSLVLTALTIAPCMPSATSCVNSTETSSNPAASRPASYSPFERAPAMQPTKLPRSARSSAVSRSSATTSLIADPAAGPQHARDLRQHRRLVDREVDHAVRDHDVDGVRRQRDLLDDALEEVDVRQARLGGVLLRQREHLVGHVEPVGGAGRPDAPGREDHVDASTGAEIEHDLTFAQVGDRGRVAAAERGAAPPPRAARPAARRRTAPRRTVPRRSRRRHSMSRSRTRPEPSVHGRADSA